jgi:hypothetical protein
MDNNMEYEGCKIIDIQRGKGERSCYTYAKLVNKDGKVLIGATLDYIVEALAARLPHKE